MKLHVDKELRAICREILAENKTDEQWAEVESDDMFQSARFVGGYSETEEAFWFSYCSENENEYWFGFTLEDAASIADGSIREILLIRP